MSDEDTEHYEWGSEEEEDELSEHTSDREFIDDDSTSDWEPEEDEFEPMEYLGDEVCGGCVLRHALDDDQLKDLRLPATDCVACTEWIRRQNRPRKY